MSSQRGFTLIELMTVIAVAAILAMVAVPSFLKIIATQRLRSAASNLQVALLVTRSESLKRNANIQLAPTTPPQWKTGWRVLNLADNSVISAYPAVPAFSIAGPAAVTYLPSGRIAATADATFKIYSDKIADVRCVTITLTGMPSVVLMTIWLAGARLLSCAWHKVVWK
jgi:type IV fimbrial biogenesis protein FimT